MRVLRNITGLLAAMVLISGCVTTGSRQLETVVTDMHARVSSLDGELTASVTELNEKTAALIARVDENERQVRLLQSLIEENQYKIDNLLQMLHNLKVALYRYWGLDPGPAPAPAIRRPEVRIEPPQRPAPEVESEEGLSESGLSAPAPEAAAPAIGDDTAYANAKALYDQEDFGAALAAFKTFQQEYPQSASGDKAQFWIGKCHLNQGEYSEAIRAFETVRKDFPESSYMAFVLHNQAVAHFRLGEKQIAVALMEEVLANYPATTAAEHARRDLEQLQGR